MLQMKRDFDGPVFEWGKVEWLAGRLGVGVGVLCGEGVAVVFAYFELEVGLEVFDL